jgi:hypothetical protein
MPIIKPQLPDKVVLILALSKLLDLQSVPSSPPKKIKSSELVLASAPKMYWNSRKP